MDLFNNNYINNYNNNNSFNLNRYKYILPVIDLNPEILLPIDR